jgi:hypothetical protein
VHPDTCLLRLSIILTATLPHCFLVYMSSPSKKIRIVVISYAVPPEAVQLREGFSISFQYSKVLEVVLQSWE